MSQFSSAFGKYELRRYPASGDPTLQAWDSADRLLLATLAEDPAPPAGSVVICNDQFGALTTALHGRRPYVWNDSALAHQAITANLARNSVDSAWTKVPSSEQIPGEADPLSLVALKVPKSLSFLEDQLARLAGSLSSETRVIGAAKVKHIHTSTLELFERYIGPTTTSLAHQKSRLIFATPRGQARLKSPWPQSFEHADRTVLGHAGVFSHRRLDIGTRLLLEQLVNNRWAEQAAVVIDLGCGNGLLGLQAIAQNQNLSCTFVDCSYLALDSAARNVADWFPTHQQHKFLLADSLGQIGEPGELLVDPKSADLVLCNPPFHDNFVMSDQTANTMFGHAAKVLRPGGRLVVVANRHLRYRQPLRTLFHSCEIAASNRKFVVTVSQNPR